MTSEFFSGLLGEAAARFVVDLLLGSSLGCSGNSGGMRCFQIGYMLALREIAGDLEYEGFGIGCAAHCLRGRGRMRVDEPAAICADRERLQTQRRSICAAQLSCQATDQHQGESEPPARVACRPRCLVPSPGTGEGYAPVAEGTSRWNNRPLPDRPARQDVRAGQEPQVEVAALYFGDAALARLRYASIA